MIREAGFGNNLKIYGVLGTDRHDIIEQVKQAYGKPERGHVVNIRVFRMSPGICGDNEGKWFGDVEITEVPRKSLRQRIRTRLARHENLFTFLWYLHLVRNEDPDGDRG
jgi:hypothetical protein